MIIKVTQDHISHGIKKSCQNCPIAFALKDALEGTIKGVHVGETLMEYRTDIKVFWTEVPSNVRDFIRRFDQGYEVHPFEFEVNFVPYKSKFGVITKLEGWL